MPTIQCCKTFVWLTTLAKNQIFFILNEAKWGEIRQKNPKGNNKHGPKKWAQKTALKLAVFSLS